MHFLLSILISVASLNTLTTCRNIFFHLICCSLLLPFLKPGYISLILISLIFLATILSPIQKSKSFPSSNVITRPCSLTTGLFLFSPVFPRSSKNPFTSDCLDFLKNLTFLVTINMASDHIILQLWRSSNL